MKARVFDGGGRPIVDSVRVPTTYPLDPDALVELLTYVAGALPQSERVSVGFPGVVRDGRVVTAPGFVATGGLGSPVSDHLTRAWSGFELACALEDELGLPTLLANDADLQGLGIVEGVGLELVVTLGSGFGTALLRAGELCPHMEFAHDLFREGETYNEQVGDEARRRVGPDEWAERVRLAIEALYRLFMFDRVWVLGGNARWVTNDLQAGCGLGSELGAGVGPGRRPGRGPVVTVVRDAAAGLRGGVRLWDGEAPRWGARHRLATSLTSAS